MLDTNKQEDNDERVGLIIYGYILCMVSMVFLLIIFQLLRR